MTRRFALTLAACLALATPSHGEETPPPMQPRDANQPPSNEPGAKDIWWQKPGGDAKKKDQLWVAVTGIDCVKYKGTVWAGVGETEGFIRFYDTPERERKNFSINKNGDVF